MFRPYKAERPIYALGNADAGRNRCFKDRPIAPAADIERPFIQPLAIEPARDCERLRELSGSVGKGRGRARYLSAFIHKRQSAQRL
jgi:hypothetical protein